MIVYIEFMKRKIRIGTRKSKLALFQAQKVSDFLIKNNCLTELVKITTTGDKFLKDTLAKTGGKGLFIKEIESALFKKEIDIAVHSLKDIPSAMNPSFTLSAYLKRDDPRDIWISSCFMPFNKGNIIRVGTSSLRRQKQLSLLNSHLQFKVLRGNIDTRFKKLKKQEYDAIVLAHAGLLRLNIHPKNTYLFSVDEIVPSVGQGVIVIESRKGDRISQLLKPLNDPVTEKCIKIERTLQSHAGGNCFTPFGAYAEINKKSLICRVFLQFENRMDFLKIHIACKPEESPGLVNKIKEKIDKYINKE